MSLKSQLNNTARAILVISVGSALPLPLVAQQDISPSVLQQIADVTTIKSSFTPAQRKIDSNLVLSALAARNQLGIASVASLVAAQGVAGINTSVPVDIYGSVTPALVGAIASVGGTVVDQSARWGLVRATLPLGSIETVAASSDVKTIQKSASYVTNGHFAPVRHAAASHGSILSRSGLNFVGALTSQGYISHAANTEVLQGFNGTGVTVGVLSDSASAARIAALIASGDLPANTAVLPGQAGPTTGSDEGTAMMEIIHDMAPGANLIFATADNGVGSFASNIIALQQAGCKVIVDDVTYFNEGAFQDGPIAQAVNQVVAAGSLYLSSAGNSGNLTDGTSGTWEGDFLANGSASGLLAGKGGFVHNFGTAASPQNFDVLTATTTFISLKWSDPLGASTNDYDLYILNSTGTAIVAMSTTTQNGTQDPYEAVSSSTGFAAGDRIVVVQVSGAQRALRIDTNRGTLSIGTTGSTFGHNGGANTVTMAATYWNSARSGTRPFVGSANPIETFSSDGPRKIFYNPNGSAITAGNFLFGTNGGITLQKPDLTAADGISAKTPGFLPFFGTSAAAPHAAGIAALVFQAKPAYTPAQVKAAMTNSALDTMAPGVDRDSGFGIAMATLAVQVRIESLIERRGNKMKISRLVQGAIAVLVTAAGANASIIFDTTSSVALSNPTQTGRLSRNGVPQDWSGAEPFSGVINTSVTYHYTTYVVNVGVTPFIQIDVDSVSANTFVSAYQSGYMPDSVMTGNVGFDTNWLGDAGTSGNYFGIDPLFFQVLVPANSNLVIVVNNTAASNVGVGDPFHLTVEGFIDSNFTDPSPVPEPYSVGLFAGGGILLLMRGRLKRFRS